MNETPPAIDSRQSFTTALGWGFASAWAGNARRIVCVDDNFAAWPLDDLTLLQGLTAWLKQPQRRLQLVARTYDELPRRCPRFTRWLADFAHVVETWQAPEELAADLPTALASDGDVAVHLVDALHWRGKAERDPRSARLWCERVDALLQRSERAFGVRTLGL